MFISEEKMSHLSHLIGAGLKTMAGVRMLRDEEAVITEIQQIMAHELMLDEQIDRLARERLASYSRKIYEGSPEWEILYRKFTEEELKRRRRL